MKKYIYEKKFFNTEVTLVAILCGLLLIASVIAMIMQFYFWIALVIFLVCAYQLINTFVSNSNPEIITIDENSISFKSFNKEDKYLFKEIDSFKVRELAGGKMYIRINEPSLKKGRYWVNAYRMNDKDELIEFVRQFEIKKHPNSLKAQAMKQSPLYKKEKE